MLESPEGAHGLISSLSLPSPEREQELSVEEPPSGWGGFRFSGGPAMSLTSGLGKGCRDVLAGWSPPDWSQASPTAPSVVHPTHP